MYIYYILLYYLDRELPESANSLSPPAASLHGVTPDWLLGYAPQGVNADWLLRYAPQGVNADWLLGYVPQGVNADWLYVTSLSDWHCGSCRLQFTSTKKSLSAFSLSRRHQTRTVCYYWTTYATHFQQTHVSTGPMLLKLQDSPPPLLKRFQWRSAWLARRF